MITVMEQREKRPDFFIVGAPKCGTTALYEYLAKHPQVFLPHENIEQKEPLYFGSDIVYRLPRTTKDQYLALYAGMKDEKRAGEASVMYLSSRKAAEEIHAFCPDALIIIMLRNPVDMMYSLHSQALYTADEDIEDFEEALNAESDRRMGRRIPRTNKLLNVLFYRDVARYAEQVERYQKTFGKENVYVIIFDDFKKDTAAVYESVLNFLGVDSTHRPDFRIVNPNKRNRSKMLLYILNAPNNIISRIARLILPHMLRSKLREKLVSINTEYSRRLPMDLNLKRRLTDEFASEIEKLSNVLGRDMSCWTHDDEY